MGFFHAIVVALAIAAVDPPQVVFIGDAITESWQPHFAELFSRKQYVGRGISGQTTMQILARFQHDVVALKPRVVVILAGTNDIAENGGPVTLEMIEDNIASMTDIARAHRIRVVLSSILPAADFRWHHGLEPAPKIIAVNSWIKRYARRTGAVYVDYHSAMADSAGGLRADLTSDGVHPNLRGYGVMSPLVERAIRTALKPGRRF